jgi:pimeloyl-ACP methyl ester carboxylesterase
MNQSVQSGYALANGVDIYWESRGGGGTPLVVVHGGFGVTSMFGDLLDQLATQRRVVAVELQGHGHTRDIDRPFSYEAFGDDLGALIDVLDLGAVDLLGYSLGGGASLRAAIQHPQSVRRLVIVSAPCRRTGWYPDVLAGMDLMSDAGFEHMRATPMYDAYLAVAPDVDGFSALMNKTGELLRNDYDWTDEVSEMTVPTMLVFGDADSIPPAHAAEFFALLGGGLQDAGWDGSLPTQNRLAILPGLTHYNIFQTPELIRVAEAFLR